MTVAEVFQQIKGARVLMLDPSGNHGDQLIFHGGRKLAEDAGLDYARARYGEDWRGLAANADAVYIQGGGGFVPFWSGAPSHLLAELAEFFQGAVIVGPSTFWPEEDYLTQSVLGPLKEARFADTHIFCRERVSYDAVRAVCANHAAIHLDHDTALALSRQDLLKLGGLEGETGLERGYDLYAIRDDLESADIGSFGIGKMPVDPIGYCYNFQRWVKLHAGAERIVTNRLHSAITGSILGVPTRLLPNSYHKARAVWEYSLKDRGVEWAEQVSPTLGDRLSGVLGLSAWWQRHFLVRRALGRIRFGAGV